MVASVLSQNLPELTVKLNKGIVHIGTLQFLEQIIRTGESQQSHHGEIMCVTSVPTAC